MSSGPPAPERWQRIEEILDRVFELPDHASSAERSALLDRLCGDDAGLRAEVEALLAAEERSGPLDADGSDPTLFHRALEDAGASPTGSRLGPYRVDRRLGAGGMGVVYEGWDTRLERPVAIKLLPPGLEVENAEDRFLREARTASALDHANICSIYDIGTTDDGRLYLVMALYRGETLRRRLDRGALELDRARNLARQLASGLHRAHGAEIIHRDIKPGNLFLTEHGELKILDFGLAKMIDDAGLTATGALLGTPAYMSPEQVRGEAAGVASDAWSFGVVLYEMLAGRRPFRSESGVGSLFATLEKDPEPLLEHRPDAPADLVEIVEQCLRRDPVERPRSMGEILERLGESSSASRSVEPSTTGSPRMPAATPARTLGLILGLFWGLLAVAAVIVLGVRLASPGPPSGEASPSAAPESVPESASGETASARSTVGLAVLPFHALQIGGAGGPADDRADGGAGAGLGRVITEMLVTDLRGSPDLDVATTSRMHRASETLGLDPDLRPSPEILERLATETGRDTVLHGSFTRLGDRFRILATLERPSSGEVLLTRQVEAAEAGLFQAVDELSAAVREVLEARAVEGGSAGVRGVTTESLEAMRFYSEGLLLYYNHDNERAIEALEKAVEIDPRFALAWRRLGLVYGNVGRAEDLRRAMDRAFELADRLPPKQRFLVRADHFLSAWSTLGRGIEVYEQGLALYPDETAWRNNLGYAYALHERYEEALAQYERSIELGTTFGYAYVNAARVAVALDRPRHGYDLLAAYAERRPGDWPWRDALGRLLVLWGRLDEAAEQLDRAEELVAEIRPKIEQNRWSRAVLAEDWSAARAAIDRMASTGDDPARWQARINEARVLLFHGRSAEALGALDEAARVPGRRAAADLLRAELFLDRGEAEAASVASRDVIDRGEEHWHAVRARFFAALAEQAQGRDDEADRLLHGLRSSAGNPVERRQVHRLAGRLASARGDLTTARRELEQAAELLPPRGIAFGAFEPEHVSTWLDLGRIHLAEGDLDAAADRLERAVGAGFERLSEPVAWARSLALLGRVQRLRGELDEARRHEERFAELWQNADLDPARDIFIR